MERGVKLTTRFKVERNKGYTVMANHHLRNKEMSLKAKGLLSLMLSLPEDWDYTEMGLVAIVKEGRASVRASLTELEELGYLKRIRERNDKGQLQNTLYLISEQPMFDYPMLDKPMLDKPMLDNRTQISTKVLSTNIQSIDETNIEIYKDILSFWNNQKIVQHRKMTDTIKGRINSKLEDYSIEEIKQSILNYSYILQSDDYFLDYRWTLVEFMDRGFEKMLNWELAEKSYRRGNVKTKDSNPFAAMLREMQ